MIYYIIDVIVIVTSGSLFTWQLITFFGGMI